MKIKVKFKDRGYPYDTYEFAGVAYAVSEEGEVDIYSSATEVCATVKADEWLFVEKIYEEGDEGPDVIVDPKAALENSTYVASAPTRLVDNEIPGFNLQVGD